MVYPRILKAVYQTIENKCRDVGLIAGKSGRHMVYPYTLAAKIAQFPFFFYLKNNWIWMYYPMGLLGGLYVFGKIHVMANSDGNVRSWAETQRKNAEKEHHH